MRILLITSEWPSVEYPGRGSFVVQRVKYLQKCGIKIKVFSFRGFGNPINYFKAWLKVRNLYNFKNFDLVDVQFGQSGLVAMPTKLPTVVTFHGSDLMGILDKKEKYTLKGMILCQISKFVSKQVNAVIVTARHLVRYLPKNLSVHIIPCGVDLELFRPIPQFEAKERLNLPKNKLLVLFVGNPIRPEKRFLLAKKVVEILKQKLDVELINIYNVSHQLVPLYMNACNVLLITSKYEGSPVAVKEALACNLPIVSTDVGDIKEQIANIDGCIVCADAKPETIAEALFKVLMRNTRINGYNAIRHLDENLLVKKVIDVYRSILS